jgi:L-ascorbate metabolism protein UlaG (beta-lactamase superfamily)
MEIRWHGHACFTLSHNGYRIVIDPYQDGMIEGCPPLRLKAEEVLCTHGHGDHAYVRAVELTGTGGGSPFAVTKLPSWHDDREGALRGATTILILESAGLRAAHMGDLGCRLTEEQLRSLRGVDVIMIPVGGFFTIDAATAKELADSVKARVVIPMHYGEAGYGLPQLAPLGSFTDLYEPSLIRRYEGDTLCLDAGTPRQVAVLRRPGA